MPKFKIVQDREQCIGCGACVAACPKFWEMGDDGKSELKGSKQKGKSFELEVASLDCNKEAAEVCPVQIIHLFDDKGKKLA